MRRLTAVVVATVATAVAIIGGAAPASASCAPPQSIPEALTTADLVVVGTVTATRSHDRIATINVDQHWKGDAGPTVEVYGGPAQDNAATSVDRTYAIGTRYLVFAFEPAAHSSPGTFGGRYEDTACSETQPWSDALASFRPASATIVTAPAPPTPSPSPVHDGGGAGRLVLAAFALLVVATFGAIAYVHWRRRVPAAT